MVTKRSRKAAANPKVVKPVLIGSNVDDADRAMIERTFKTFQETKEAYAKYAHAKGFGITTHSQRKDEKNKAVVKYATYKCNKRKRTIVHIRGKRSKKDTDVVTTECQQISEARNHTETPLKADLLATLGTIRD